MNGFRRLIELYTQHYNKMFWLLFAVAGAVYIAAIFWIISPFHLDLVLGLIIIFAGIHRLGAEFIHRSLRKSQDETVRAVNELLQWAEKSYDYTRAFKDRHERRIYRLDQKRAALEDKLEEQFRSAVKKIIELENKLNRLARALGEERAPPRPEKPARQPRAEVKKRPPGPRLADLTRTQQAAVSFIRERGRITNKEYRQRFRVSEKKAFNDLTTLHKIGLLKRRGQGRSTHYVLAF